MKAISVIMRDYSVKNPEMRDHYIGAVCQTFEEAREVVYGHHHRGCDYNTEYVNNGTNYVEIDGETGEVVAEYFVRLVVNN